MAKPEQNPSRVRIVAGKWRGNKVQFSPARGLRPTGDRIRETLFNWLQTEIQGASCLDLFAGSGSLGFEAASRGANTVAMVELYEPTMHQLRQQIARLNADNITVWHGAAIDYLQRFDYQFDVVFLDPPFDSELLQLVLNHFFKGNNLHPDSKIYCEYPAETVPVLAPGWGFIKQKKAAAVGYGLITRRLSENKEPTANPPATIN